MGALEPPYQERKKHIRAQRLRIEATCHNFTRELIFVFTNDIFLRGEKRKRRERERGDREAKGSREGPSKRVMATVVEQCYLISVEIAMVPWVT